MIIVKLISGLGNQLFQYAVARQLSLNANTTLKLDLSFFDDQSLRAYKLDKFNIKAEIATIGEINKFKKHQDQSLHSKFLQLIQARLPKHRLKVFKENEWWVYEPSLYRTRSNVYIDGYWQHYKYLETLDPIIYSELTLKNDDDLKNPRVADLVSSMSSESVSIHIRRTDYLTDLDAANLMGALPLEYYKNAIQYMSSSLKDPLFYIFSDDLDWARQNINIDYPMVFVDIADGKKDYLELIMMSKCHHNIIANSTFSWWGAFLNQHPDKIVIAPKNWVRHKVINEKIKIIPEGWVKL